MNKEPIKIYILENCSTCKRAILFLKENNIPFAAIPIKETPPSLEELKLMLDEKNGEVRKLFNTSGNEYKDKNLKDLLPTLSNEEALELLNKSGMLVKRPFVISPKIKLLGFKESEWDQAFS
ncbi:Spx/MgsR family RNA polymerase-binding regulatory protein [Criblamydia sequanensis]|uniref:Arsenate reductase n=1 Tax=Candidatus Criblamydia sequanensis CRIB-18 TaxID=1437425 RepID=A0A090D2W4_9BACT|nr:Spx/MgsR family RNA polymerase-binding regulatory protein [Criblamydia sequanensis]CDR35005.1 Conserved hypothetical protein [Criblamydia sequanensis CRIB-18]